MIKNAATTKAASNTSPGLLLLFYITIGTLPPTTDRIKPVRVKATPKAIRNMNDFLFIFSPPQRFSSYAG
jgi:hypothetical protein